MKYETCNQQTVAYYIIIARIEFLGFLLNQGSTIATIIYLRRTSAQVTFAVKKSFPISVISKKKEVLGS